MKDFTEKQQYLMTVQIYAWKNKVQRLIQERISPFHHLITSDPQAVRVLVEQITLECNEQRGTAAPETLNKPDPNNPAKTIDWCKESQMAFIRFTPIKGVFFTKNDEFGNTAYIHEGGFDTLF